VSKYSLTHLSDSTLRNDLHAAVARERAATVEVLAHIAEFDARKLYLPAGYPSMYAYCLGELRLSEQAAFKRILVARAARKFASIFPALVAGRVHMSALVMLAPHLTPETADELVAAATHRTKVEIETLLAQRFPRPDLPTHLRPVVPVSASIPELSPGIVPPAVDTAEPGSSEPLPEARVAELSPGIAAASGEADGPAWREASIPRPRLQPLAPERYALQVTLGQRARDNLRAAQELGPTGDIAGIIDEALALYVRHLENRKFAATDRPRQPRSRSHSDHRHIPADVQRAVWKRDGGRCTFESDTGRRCPARTPLEFDHVHEFARGGQATVSGIRLRCRAHNQYGAELAYGVEFMRRKREAARSARAESRALAAECPP